MKISIIIPVYNVEQYIIECLESVAQQTYKEDIECIIVDDCGTDNSIPYAEKFVNNYNGNINFRIIHHIKNRGLSAARNTGTNAATGDYIFYLDSDDKIIPDCIKLMVYTAVKFPKAELIQGGIINNNNTENYDISNKKLPDYAVNIRWIKANLMTPGKLPVSSWNKLIKLDFLKQNRIEFIEGIIHEDAPFAFHMAQCLHCIAFCKENTYIYRTQRTGSIQNSSSLSKAFMSRMIAYQYCLCHLDDVYKDIQTKSIFLRFQYALLTMPKTEDAKKESVQLYNNIIQQSPLKDRVFIRLHKMLPNRIRCWHPVYKLFHKLFEINTI